MSDRHSFVGFRNAVAEIAAPEAKRRLVDGYLKDLEYPVFEGDSSVILLYRGRADAVHIAGDMTHWVESLPFTRISGTDLFWFRGTYEPDARLEYVLQVSGAEAPITDPLNPYAVHGFVLNSELAMPRYRRHRMFEPYKDGRKGGFELLHEYTLPAGVLPYSHTIHVYTPPEYTQMERRFPCVYFQDGRDYIEYGIAPLVLHTLIQSGRIEPLIGVFVTPPNLHLPQTPNRTNEYGMSAEYVEFFTEELRVWVDAHFRTVCDRSARLVVGDSYGGLISITIGLRRPDIFGIAYSQSGYMSFKKDLLLQEVAGTEPVRGRFYLDCGTYEQCVGRGIVPDEEGDFLAANRRMARLMQHKHIDMVYREYHEGHTWGNWRGHLHDALEHFFGSTRERGT